MAKTFLNSPVAGVLAAILGWIGALTFKSSMSPAEFSNLRFGWEGTMVGAIAAACILMLLLTKGMVDPLVVVASSAVAAALLWDRREFPFNTNNFKEGTAPSYWFTVTTMVLIFVLLVMGLRAARESNNRARG